MDAPVFRYNSTPSETSKMSPGEDASSTPSFVTQALPKAQPPTPLFSSIDTAYSTTPVSYPDPDTYNFQLSKKKRADRSLDIYYCGVLDTYNRSWSFTIVTPPCFMVFAKTFENEAPNSRALLCPMYRDGSVDVPTAEPFLKFLQHIEDISQYLKARMTDDRNYTSFWTSPLRIENGLLEGLQAKIKTDSVRTAILAHPYNTRGFLKLTCIYFANRRSGISFELVEALPAS